MSVSPGSQTEWSGNSYIAVKRRRPTFHSVTHDASSRQGDSFDILKRVEKPTSSSIGDQLNWGFLAWPQVTGRKGYVAYVGYVLQGLAVNDNVPGSVAVQLDMSAELKGARRIGSEKDEASMLCWSHGSSMNVCSSRIRIG
jgi:hypothetical protein